VKKNFAFWTLAVVAFALLFSVIVLFGFLVVVFASPEAGLLPGFKTYRSKKLGIEFKYPKILKVRKKDGVVTISHRVPFEHEDPCDRGWPPEKAKEIWDFYVRMIIVEKTPNEILGEQLEKRDGVLIFKSDVRVTYGQLDGFRIYNGNHGCGPYAYFFQLTKRSADPYNKERYLRVDRYPAPELRKVSEEEKLFYSRLRLIILPEQEEHLFQEILTSLTWK